MWLAINVGNTNVKFGLIRDGDVSATRRAETRPEATADEVEWLLDELLGLDGRSLADVDGLVLASVVPPYGRALTAVAERRGIPLLEATPETIPVPVRVARPAEVGADRLVNALAVQRLYGSPAIVVDFGTATTFDAVAADGAYVGGAIAPGLELGLAALAERTAQLPRVEAAAPRAAIGRDTVSAMRSGAVFGHIGLARELLARITDELEQDAAGNRVRIVLTGGLSSASWFRELPGVDAVDPDLTLKGLALLHAGVTAGIPR